MTTSSGKPTGGDIRLASVLGAGSAFTHYQPLTPDGESGGGGAGENEYPLPCLPGLDAAAALHRLAGDRELLWMAMDKFLADFSDTEAELQKELQEGRLEDAKRRVHSIKSVAGTIGAEDLQQAAAVLEKAMGLAEGARAVEHDRFLCALRAILSALSPWLHERQGSGANGPDAVGAAEELLEMETKRDKPVILVVDDTETNIDILLHTLAQEYDVSVAMEGETALRIVEELKPDLVLLDIMMPGLDGYEVCRRLKANTSTQDIPVVFLTALMDDSAEEKGLNLGAIDYITKPFNPALVRARVNNYLVLRRSQLENIRQRNQISEAYAKLLSLEKQRDDLVHMLVHDMRSPLMAISGNLELALIEQDVAPDFKAWPNIKDAFTNSKVLSAMVSSVLDVSRLEAGQMPLHQRLCSLDELVRQALGRVEGLALRERIRINAGPAPLTAFCDPEIIARVMVNLISNALKFTPADGSITIDLDAGPGWSTISISDTGPGIAPEYHEKVFEKFIQAEARKDNRQLSTGLGLTFCKLAIEAHGGAIRVESELGQGTTFRVCLPSVAANIRQEG